MITKTMQVWADLLHGGVRFAYLEGDRVIACGVGNVDAVFKDAERKVKEGYNLSLKYEEEGMEKPLSKRNKERFSTLITS